MWSFFAALFGAICIGVVYAKDARGKSQYQAHAREMKSRSDKWFAKVNKGPLNNYQFYQKIKQDYAFRENLYRECNDILDSIPELEGLRLIGSLNSNSISLMEMMFNARTGDISVMWHSGYVLEGVLTEGLYRRPSPKGAAALISWYQNELRKNGRPDATILPVRNSAGHVIAWRFEDGATEYEQIKRELFITK